MGGRAKSKQTGHSNKLASSELDCDTHPPDTHGGVPGIGLFVVLEGATVPSFGGWLEPETLGGVAPLGFPLAVVFISAKKKLFNY